MRVQVNAGINLEVAADRILDAANNTSSLDGLGADSDSVYNVDDISIEPGPNPGQWILTYELSRESGKFATKDEVGEALESELFGEAIELDLEG